MRKITLSLLMLVMKYQGRSGKYYTIQKVSFALTGFTSLFLTGLIKKLFLLRDRDQIFFLFLLVWVSFFLIHYIWFY